MNRRFDVFLLVKSVNIFIIYKIKFWIVDLKLKKIQNKYVKLHRQGIKDENKSNQMTCCSNISKSTRILYFMCQMLLGREDTINCLIEVVTTTSIAYNYLCALTMLYEYRMKRMIIWQMTCRHDVDATSFPTHQ